MDVDMDGHMEYTGGRMISRPRDFPVLPNVEKDDDDYVPIWLDDVRCAGTVGDDGFLDMANHWRGSKPTTLLHHCYNAGVGLDNCKHSEDVHLQCTGAAGQRRRRKRRRR